MKIDPFDPELQARFSRFFAAFLALKVKVGAEVPYHPKTLENWCLASFISGAELGSDLVEWEKRVENLREFTAEKSA